MRPLTRTCLCLYASNRVIANNKLFVRAAQVLLLCAKKLFAVAKLEKAIFRTPHPPRTGRVASRT